MNIFGLLDGSSVLVVGVEDDPEPGLLRVYIGARYNGTYVLIEDAGDQERVRSTWGSAGHVFMPRPPDERIYVDDPKPTTAAEGFDPSATTDTTP